MFEYPGGLWGVDASTYWASVHDWYGVSGQPCPAGETCDAGGEAPFTPPAGATFDQPHRYGLLWIPATAKKPGQIAYYFDGQLVRAFTYAQFTGQAPPPDGQPWLFGAVDNEHLVLLIGGGAAAPTRVRSLAVWQLSAAANRTN